ncbi:hypothetical protein ACX27_14050 [Nostoc piscinale CENA21]|uniref:DUF1648 domain-containing protein n=1 Tax=Nostoc piscinale CENA21 TaxID=224013 RepID=A0A0M4SXI7_9NOSO|nr:DUF1648 domain-containing protein [Nostoc piscinale]ALF53709.1 hypothetical protein ACX27_14050 [Nostoc piscinale CENA21]
MSRHRPGLVIPQSSSDQILNWIAIAGIAGLFGLAVYTWFALPETIPIHFGFDGKVNGWGSKKIIWLLPILSLVTYSFLTFISRYPHTFNYAVTITEVNALRQYQIACSMLNWLKTEMVYLSAYIEWQIYHLATTANPSLGIWFLPGLIIIIFGTIGYWLRQSFLAR